MAALVLSSLAGCGDDGPDGPIATVTAGELGAIIITDGFVYDAGHSYPVEFVNERDVDVTLRLWAVAEGDELLVDDPPADTVIAEVAVPAGGSVTETIDFSEPGEFASAVDPPSDTSVRSAGGVLTIG